MKVLTLAGAGAGKTRSLVNEVKSILPDLAETPYRYCAVITYTKAATEVIRSRLAKQVPIPNNVFIGTTHSFLIRFVIEPYAHLLKVKQHNGTYKILAPNEKSYVDCIELSESVISRIKAKPINSKDKELEKKKTILIIISKLCEQGVITYDKILSLSRKILETAKIRDLVAERLRYVFIDEYQDITDSQHKLFQSIYGRGKTNFFYIGDPLQSIFGFAYSKNQTHPKSAPDFKESPILKLIEHSDITLRNIEENYRSSEEIVKFTNNYTSSVSEFKQKSIRGKLNLPIMFIQNNLLSNSIQIFEKLIEIHKVKSEPNKLYKLLLAHSFKPEEFSKAVQSQQVEQLDFENHSINNQFQIISKCIQGVLAMKKKDIFEQIPHTNEFEKTLEYRSFCLDTLEKIKSGEVLDLAEFARSEMQRRYGYTFSTEEKQNYLNIDMQGSIKSLAKSAKRKESDKYYSTIHKAKGLEATCVLVCAKTSNELEKWLDYEKAEESNDDYRLGYVAFSRARNFLCICCLQDISSNLKNKIENFNMKFV